MTKKWQPGWTKICSSMKNFISMTAISIQVRRVPQDGGLSVVREGTYPLSFGMNSSSPAICTYKCTSKCEHLKPPWGVNTCNLPQLIPTYNQGRGSRGLDWLHMAQNIENWIFCVKSSPNSTHFAVIFLLKSDHAHNSQTFQSDVQNSANYICISRQQLNINSDSTLANFFNKCYKLPIIYSIKIC